MLANLSQNIHRRLEYAKNRGRDLFRIDPDTAEKLVISMANLATYQNSSYFIPDIEVLEKAGLVRATGPVERELLNEWRDLVRDPHVAEDIRLGYYDESGLIYACSDFVLSSAYRNGERFYKDAISFYTTSTLEDWKDLYEEKRRQSPERPPRIIEMELYPLFFSLISSGRKKVEGRAFKPTSEKDYAGIKEGDTLHFRINRERVDWYKECLEFDVNPDSIMTAEVVRLDYAPFVNIAFHDSTRSGLGQDYQPQIVGFTYPTAIRRAAVYYSIPGYIEQIRENGFLGIELKNPTLI